MSGTRRADGPNKGPRKGPSAGRSSRTSASKSGAKPGTKGPTKKRGIVKQVLGIGGPNDWRAWVQRFLVLCITFVLVCVGAFFVMYEATTIPNPNAAYQTQTTTVYFADGKPIGTFATQNRTAVSLSQVALPMQEAAVAAEDRTFWTNKGIDIKSILRSVWNDAGGGATQGGSTITMQYVKILYLNQAQTIMRKIKQVFLALKIQKQESKQEILQGYLNTIYFGRGAYGIEAAAQAYFGNKVHASQLNVAQSAMLAAIINEPSYLSPDDPKSAAYAALLGRYQYVLNGLVSMGKLDSASEAGIYSKLPHVVDPNTSDQYAGQNGFILSMVKQQLLKLGLTEEQIYGSGLHVTTTLTRKAMNAAKAAVDQVKPSGVSNLHAATASIDVKTGALLGFYAGQNFQKSQLNWALLPNPVGSVFKVPSLAMALTSQAAGGGGWSLQSTFSGDSITLPGVSKPIFNEQDAAGQPSSYGPAVPLLKGLEQSINTVFVDMTRSTNHGAQKILNMAEAMGIPGATQSQRIKTGLTYSNGNGGETAPTTISLGSASVSPVDIANTYATVANGGMAHPWYVVSKVTDSTGKVIWQHTDTQKQAMTPQVAADVSYAMQQVVKSGTGQKASALGCNQGACREDAGKTGTATGLGNVHVITSWFAGFTPQVATAVIYLRTSPKSGAYLPLDGYLNPFFGANYPTETWTAVMNGIMSGLPLESFPPQGNVKASNNSSGHAPLPTFTPSATNTPTKKPTKKPTQAPPPPPTPTTSPTPSDTPTPSCVPTLLNPCSSSSP